VSARTLLVVDSYPAARQALADLLRESGYAVREAHNGMEGLRIARDAAPDLVLVDLWPFFSASVQLMERLRASRGSEPVPVLVVTSVVDAHHRDRALAAGCSGFLEKPCAPQAVLSEVQRILGAPN
jgi:two-component system, cell cycle response regulator DivK